MTPLDSLDRFRVIGRADRLWLVLESVRMDVRYALRQLRRAPGVAAIIVLTLGVGIAAVTTVFSWTSAVLLDPLPGAAEAGRVQALEYLTPSGSWTPTSWPDFGDLRRDLRSFDGLAAAYPNGLAVGEESHAELRSGEIVSANFFDVLRVRPALGRFFPPGMDDAEGGLPVAVISYKLWRSHWQGDSGVVGRTVHVNRYPFTVIGVAPPTFHGSMPGEDVDIWVPAAMVRQILPTLNSVLQDRAWRTWRVLARLAPGVTPAAARDEVARVATALAKVNGGRSEGMSATVMPLWRSHWGVQDALRAPLLVLLAACGLVLLIVCANMANLLLTRAIGRRREFGLRLALGAPRRRLVRQLLTEALLLAAAGSALGLLGTTWLTRALRWLLPAFAAPALRDPQVNPGVLAFAAALTCGVTLLAGVAPALYGSRERSGDALHESGRGASGGLHASRLRGAIVVAEMALAVIALVGAGWFYASFRHARVVPPGFTADGVAMGTVSLTLAGYDSAAADAFLQRVTDRLRSEPSITAVSVTDYVTISFGRGSWEDLSVEGYAPQPNENMKLYRTAVLPDYFRALRIPVLAGRDFRLDDDSAHAPVMIVDQAFVRHFLRGGSALGVRVRGWGRWFTIVGVVQDVRNYRLTEPPAPYFYVPVRQVYRPEYGYTFLARTTGAVEQGVQAIVRAVKASDPSVPVYGAMPLAAYIGAPLGTQQTAARLLALLAAIALLLAAIGLYGVVAYSVAQRSREIGIRVALGARPSDVVRAVAAQAGVVLVGGLAIGLGGAAALGRVVSSLLFGVNAADPSVFAAASGVMVMIAVAAAGIPARRAVRVDPVVTLRAD